MKETIIIGCVVLLFSCKDNAEQADAYGNFEATTLFVSAEVNGKLLKFDFEEGDQVKKSSLIALIDSTQLFLRKDQLQLSITALESKLQNVPIQLESLREREKLLKLEVSRTRRLLEDSAATQKQLDDINGESNVIAAQLAAMENQLSTANRSILAEIKPLEAQIAQVEDQLLRCKVLAPISGTVLEKFKEEGELVMTGQPLIKMADLSQLTLRGYVSGDQLSTIKLGQEVKVSVDAPEGGFKVFNATISWISDQAEFTPKVIQTKEERVNLVYATKFLIKNDGTLKIGMPGEVHF